MKKVSVIVPVYNNGDYIDECLESITNQTYKNLEIILINDGSTDNTDTKISSWRKKDKRIIYFSNSNHGVSFSRNFGIKKSSGNYLTFIDADDIIAPDFIESLLKSMIKNKVDCSVCGIHGFYKTSEIIQTIGQIQIYKKSLIKDTLLSQCGGFLANKMYKSKIIKENQIKLNEEISISEDLLFNLEYFNYCESISYDNSIKYFYRQYSTSSYNNLNNEKWFSVIDTYITILTTQKLIKNIDKNKIISKFCLTLAEAKYRVKKVCNNSKRYQIKVKESLKEYATLKNFFKMNNIDKIKFIILMTVPSLVMRYKRRRL